MEQPLVRVRVTTRLQVTALVTLTCLVKLSWSPAADSGSEKVEHLEGGYTVQVPADLKVAQVSTVGDFVLYRLTDGAGKLVLAIYLGNFPDTKIKPSKDSVKSSSSIAGLAATSYRWRESNGSYAGTTLIRLSQNGPWPEFAHLFFNGLSRTESESAEGIVHSFHKEIPPKRQ
jgi:hypothetical protein